MKKYTKFYIGVSALLTNLLLGSSVMAECGGAMVSECNTDKICQEKYEDSSMKCVDTGQKAFNPASKKEENVCKCE